MRERSVGKKSQNTVWQTDRVVLLEPHIMPPVDTRISSGYRTLRFDSIEECISDINRIVAASDAGTLDATGNWTPGQVMTHLANWIQYPYAGFPIAAPPFFVRWMLRIRRRKILEGSMPRGVHIPGVAGGTVGMEDVAADEAARRLLAALERLRTDEEPKFDSPAFGAMSHEDRIALNLRHAELHLGFLRY